MALPTLTTLVSLGGFPSSLIADATGNLFGTTVGGTVFEIPYRGNGVYGALTTLVNVTDFFRFGSQVSLVADATGNLFGTILNGDTTRNGTSIFEIPYQGNGVYGAVTTLANFNFSRGNLPTASLMADVSGNLFGTTRIGFADQGTVFEIPKTATGYGAPTTLAIFNGTNGANPDGALIANAAGDLFGTTSAGSTTASGLPGSGTVFEIPYQGNGVYGAVTTLVTFNGTGPHAGLLADTAGNLFGTTSGPLGQGGTVFEIPKSATGYGALTTLAIFNGTRGAGPIGGLLADTAGNLFGTTGSGLQSDQGGTVFEIAKTANGYGLPTVLWNFTNGGPLGALVADTAGNLFGTAGSGVFELTNTGFTILHDDGPPPITHATLGRPVFRFFDTHDGGHFFTTSSIERDDVRVHRPDMRFEGVGYNAVDPASSDPNAAPVYRFFDTHDGGHFFTISQAERDQVLNTRPDLKFEGAGYSEHTTQQAGDNAVYRFFETTSGGHFFTASATERDTVMATRSDMRFEGIAFYAPT